MKFDTLESARAYATEQAVKDKVQPSWRFIGRETGGKYYISILNPKNVFGDTLVECVHAEDGW